MSYVRVERADAVALAELEQRSLMRRAEVGGKCADLWRGASHAARDAAWALKNKRDREATRHMYSVARQWRGAFECEHPSPPTAMGEVSAGGMLGGLALAAAAGVIVYLVMKERKEPPPRRVELYGGRERGPRYIYLGRGGGRRLWY